jgi:hypothetical protein
VRQLPVTKTPLLKNAQMVSHLTSLYLFVGVAPIFAISFFGFGVGKKLLQQEDQPLSNSRLFLAGAFSGIHAADIH